MAHKREAVPVRQPDVIETDVTNQALGWYDFSTQRDIMHVLHKNDHAWSQSLIAQMRQHRMEIIPSKKCKNHSCVSIQPFFRLGQGADTAELKRGNALDGVESFIFNPIV